MRCESACENHLYILLRNHPFLYEDIKKLFQKYLFEKVISKEFVFYTVFKMSTQEGRQARKIRIIAKTVHNQVVIRLLFSSRQNRINLRTFKEVSKESKYLYAAE